MEKYNVNYANNPKVSFSVCLPLVAYILWSCTYLCCSKYRQLCCSFCCQRLGMDLRVHSVLFHILCWNCCSLGCLKCWWRLKHIFCVMLNTNNNLAFHNTMYGRNNWLILFRRPCCSLFCLVCWVLQYNVIYTRPATTLTPHHPLVREHRKKNTKCLHEKKLTNALINE